MAADFLKGGRWTVVAEFTETEGDRRDERPELAKALAACRRHGATLLIARLDRLCHDAHFLSDLQEAGVDFVAADMPEANGTTIGLMVRLAHRQREVVGARIKAALAAAKAKGVRLGNPDNLSNRALGTERGNATKAAKAARRAADLAPVIRELQAAGAVSLHRLAAGLNARGIPAPRGGQWSATQVSRLKTRLARLAPPESQAGNARASTTRAREPVPADRHNGDRRDQPSDRIERMLDDKLVPVEVREFLRRQDPALRARLGLEHDLESYLGVLRHPGLGPPRADGLHGRDMRRCTPSLPCERPICALCRFRFKVAREEELWSALDLAHPHHIGHLELAFAVCDPRRSAVAEAIRRWRGMLQDFVGLQRRREPGYRDLFAAGQFEIEVLPGCTEEADVGDWRRAMLAALGYPFGTLDAKALVKAQAIVQLPKPLGLSKALREYGGERDTPDGERTRPDDLQGRFRVNVDILHRGRGIRTNIQRVLANALRMRFPPRRPNDVAVPEELPPSGVRQPTPTPVGSDRRRRADEEAAQAFIRLHADLSLEDLKLTIDRSQDSMRRTQRSG